MRLVLLRHYKTQINAQQCLMGWGDSPPVDDWESDLVAVLRELEQARLQARCIYTSELRRARATGEYLARSLGIGELISDAALNEINYGDLYLRSKVWVAKHIPQYKTDPDFVFPGGESFRQMQRRSAAFIAQLARRHAGETLLMVAHAGVIRGLICHFLDLPYAPNLKHIISHRYIGEFRFEDGRCQSYDELGTPSEFIDQGVIALPCRCPAPAR